MTTRQQPTSEPVADLQHEGKSTTYNVGDIRTCRNCDQPIYFGGIYWWHRHNESQFCVKAGSEMRRAEPDLDEVERVRAAAPELLKALKSAVEWMAQELENIGGCDHSVGICCCGDVRLLEDCKEAISKAEAH